MKCAGCNHAHLQLASQGYQQGCYVTARLRMMVTSHLWPTTFWPHHAWPRRNIEQCCDDGIP